VSTLDTCGCFGAELAVPAIWNPPGLAQLAFRTGTQPTILARLLHDLDELEPDGPLAALTTRELDDPAIGLLDAFASVADVLGFYAERIAGEGFLRTATERRSVLELARAIGYELGPGVAAQAWLAFAVEDRGAAEASLHGEPLEVQVPAGTAVQSVPSEQDELPQTFETSADLTARAAWNELRPRRTRPQELRTDAGHVYLAGTARMLSPGDLVVLAAGEPEGPIEGTPVTRRVERVTVEMDAEPPRTRVELDGGAALGPQAAPSARAGASVGFERQSFTGGAIEHAMSLQWSGPGIAAWMALQNWPLFALNLYLSAPEPPTPDLPPAAPGFYALRRRAPVFGHNAPRWHGQLIGWESPASNNWNSGKNITESGGGEGPVSLNAVRLDAEYDDILADSWAVLEQGDKQKLCRVGAVQVRSEVDFAVSARATSLQLKETDGATNVPSGDLDDFMIRKATVHCASERLELAELPEPEELEAGETELELDTPGLALIEAGTAIAVTGELFALPGLNGSEVLTVREVTVAGRHTTLHVDPLSQGYRRPTVVLNANVAEATHGETVAREVLGGGSGAPDQRFKLLKPPVTHVPAATGRGVRSTLEVRVDGVRWDEAPALYGVGPRAERFVTRRDDGGGVGIVFGDGERGARVPSGQENVVARYRSGIGRAGMVAARSLTLMPRRPLGIREVVNPLPAGGAEDPEDRDHARENAPLTVLTLDRVVSLSDYEDFARAFAGIGKARATALWSGERQLVHITIAGPLGDEIDAQSAARTDLIDALDAARDPGREVQVGGFRRIYFDLTVGVVADSRQESATVTEAVRVALGERFSFAQREFGQAVAAAEVVACAIGVRGVVDARVEVLRPTAFAGQDPGPERQDPLLAALARWSGAAGGQIEAAELLLLNPLGATVTERSA
jgi:predicted phage baseplate assembly protein